jgi:hypothetical protein
VNLPLQRPFRLGPGVTAGVTEAMIHEVVHAEIRKLGIAAGRGELRPLRSQPAPSQPPFDRMD